MELVREETSLIDYWKIVVRRRWTVYLAVASSTLIALIASFAATPLYRSTTTLQIERKNPDILTFRDLGQVDYSWAAYADFYQTQYRIIASEPVARRTVQRMGLADHPEFENADAHRGWRARLKAFIPRKKAQREYDAGESATARVRARLEVRPIRNSHLVEVSWISPNSELAADVANGIADAYIQLNMESQYSVSGQAEEFLVDQIGALKREIAELESRVQQYGESKRIVSIDDSNNITLQALKNISERRTAAQTTLAAAEAAYEAAMQAPAGALPEVISSPLITRLREEYAALEARYTEMSERFGEDWPDMQTLKSKIEQAKTRLEIESNRIAEQVRAAAQAAYLKALSEVRNLDRLVAEQENAAQQLKRDAVEFANLQSEAQKKRETLDALIARQNEVALSTRLKDLDVTSSNIRIIDRAEPPRAPFRPNTKLNLVLGLIFGLLFGVVLAIVLDHLDNTVATIEEVQRLTGLPVLAVIPRHGEGSSTLARVRSTQSTRASETLDLVAHRDRKAGAAEAYRDLRTALLLSNPGQPPRSILITSAIPEEGKTATAINLAAVLAQLGARVLLVDTDLRRPRLHKALDVRNQRGISNCLSGLEDDMSRLAVPTGIENLDLLPSGPIPPNPSELLNSRTFEQLCRQFLERGYDHVVFDSPPVLSVSDPVILANVLDSCILVVRVGRTPRQSVRLAVDKLRQSGETSIGVVLNDLSRGAAGSSHYGYRYDDRYTEPEDRNRDRDRAGGAAGA